MDYKERLNNLVQSSNVDSENTDFNNNNNNNLDKSRCSIDKIESFMNNKIVNMYSRNWSKLEYKLKINKINEFVEEVYLKYNFSDLKKSELKSFLDLQLKKGKLNKINEIVYDKVENKILEVKKLKIENDFFEFSK